MQRIRGHKSLFAGLIFVGLGLVFGISALSLSIGSAARMGPGYFPLILAVALGLLGIVVVLDGVFRADAAPDGFSIRAIAVVLASVVVFALAIERLGLVPTVALTSLLLSLADREFRLVPALGAAVVLAGFSWLVFAFALSLPWPAFGPVFN